MVVLRTAIEAGNRETLARITTASQERIAELAAQGGEAARRERAELTTLLQALAQRQQAPVQQPVYQPPPPTTPAWVVPAVIVGGVAAVAAVAMLAMRGKKNPVMKRGDTRLYVPPRKADKYRARGYKLV